MMESLEPRKLLSGDIQIRSYFLSPVILIDTGQSQINDNLSLSLFSESCAIIQNDILMELLGMHQF